MVKEQLYVMFGVAFSLVGSALLLFGMLKVWPTGWWDKWGVFVVIAFLFVALALMLYGFVLSRRNE